MSSRDGANSQPRKAAGAKRKYEVRSSSSAKGRAGSSNPSKSRTSSHSGRSSGAGNRSTSQSKPFAKSRTDQSRNRSSASRGQNRSQDSRAHTTSERSAPKARNSSGSNTSRYSRKSGSDRTRTARPRSESADLSRATRSDENSARSKDSRRSDPGRSGRDERPRSDRTRSATGRNGDSNRSSSTRSGAGNRGGRDRADRPQKFDTPRRFRGDLPRRERDQRARGTAPVIDQDITGDELGEELTAELRTLPGGLTITVAQHLVMTQRYLEIDPPLALIHAKHAKELAGRFPIVREIVGIAHYLNGNWQEALNDFRAVKRMGPADHLVAMMADCERGLGRPERAIAMLSEMRNLTGVDRIEAAIVESGARVDLNQLDAALVALKIPALTGFPADQTAYARLCFSYGAVLDKLGRADEARTWYAKAHSADPAATLAADQLPVSSGEIYLDDLDAE